MTHDHASHAEKLATYDRAFTISIIANASFVAIQIFFAYLTNSSSLFADAIHNLGDVFSLILAFTAATFAKRAPTINRTYGLKKSSIMAALVNGIFLVFSCGVIITEAVLKWLHPQPVMALSVMVIASIGIVVNGLTALLFVSQKNDLNIRAAFLHLLSDALVSLAVVISAALLYWTNWIWLDPLVSILIACVILKGTWFLFIDAFRLILDGVPRHISVDEVQALLKQQPGVQEVHDLHVWALSTSENALSVHLLMPENPLTDEARHRLNMKLKKEHHIQHTTIQVEQLANYCEDACH